MPARTDACPSSTAFLTLQGIGKNYATPVLEAITLDLQAGQVLALTGENGAGKSTLSKIICGLINASAGTMQLDGQPYQPTSRTEAEALGIRMVMQELNLIPTLTIAENLFLGKLPQRLGWIDQHTLIAHARKQMAVVGLEDLDPNTLVGDLGLGHQQMVEIARNLIGSCRCLVLDEPTAMLTNREVALLFARIETLRTEGVAIIYISHRLEELKRIADRIVVLRDGKLVCDQNIHQYSTEQLVQLMAGELTKVDMDARHRPVGAPLLKVRELGRRGAVHSVSFDLHAGEILGVAGLIGSGRSELLRLIFGADHADHGAVYRGDAPQPLKLSSPKQAVQAGIAMVTEDRKEQGLLLSQSIAINTSLANLRQVNRAGLLDHAAEAQVAHDFVDTLRIRAQHIHQASGELSGGNQQKVVIARWLYRDCPIMLFDEPTRGIDIGAKADIYKLLAELAAQGKGLLVVSSDLRELMHICDRIAVMSAGHLVDTYVRNDWSQERILSAAFSAYVQPSDHQAVATSADSAS